MIWASAFDSCLTLGPDTVHVTYVRSAQTVEDGPLWLVRLELDAPDTIAFTKLTRTLVTRTAPRNELAIILHGPPGGLVLAAPAVVQPVTQLDLDGGSTEASAATILDSVVG